ncbi:MAG TPA: hypothetical protein VIK78_14550 [Ruminiclostridium sp.]
MITKSIFYFKFNTTSWREKTVAVGIGRKKYDIEEDRTLYFLGVILYFWYLTIGIKF